MATAGTNIDLAVENKELLPGTLIDKPAKPFIINLFLSHFSWTSRYRDHRLGVSYQVESSIYIYRRNYLALFRYFYFMLSNQTIQSIDINFSDSPSFSLISKVQPIFLDTYSSYYLGLDPYHWRSH